MASHQFFDRVQETTSSPGTGNVSLAGAVSQYVTFNSTFGLNNQFYYTIADTSGTNWEVGEGHLSASTTLVRDNVLASSNSGSLVNFSSGTQAVWNDISAMSMNIAPTFSQLYAIKCGYALQ